MHRRRFLTALTLLPVLPGLASTSTAAWAQEAPLVQVTATPGATAHVRPQQGRGFLLEVSG